MYTTRRSIKQVVNSGHSVCLCVWCSSQKQVTFNSLVFVVVTDWNLALCGLQLVCECFLQQCMYRLIQVT